MGVSEPAPTCHQSGGASRAALAGINSPRCCSNLSPRAPPPVARHPSRCAPSPPLNPCRSSR
eukprot:1922461-Prymnesium_polylepis.1